VRQQEEHHITCNDLSYDSSEVCKGRALRETSITSFVLMLRMDQGFLVIEQFGILAEKTGKCIPPLVKRKHTIDPFLNYSVRLFSDYVLF
jgi:hypothetical protein